MLQETQRPVVFDGPVEAHHEKNARHGHRQIRVGRRGPEKRPGNVIHHKRPRTGLVNLTLVNQSDAAHARQQVGEIRDHNEDQKSGCQGEYPASDLGLQHVAHQVFPALHDGFNDVLTDGGHFLDLPGRGANDDKNQQGHNPSADHGVGHRNSDLLGPQMGQNRTDMGLIFRGLADIKHRERRGGYQQMGSFVLGRFNRCGDCARRRRDRHWMLRPGDAQRGEKHSAQNKTNESVHC